jgi:hypothetical protein
MERRVGSSAEQAPQADSPGSKAAVGWEAVQPDAPPLHVITLVSSTAPVPLRAPTAPELAGLAVFRSRHVEDGRERFRLHIGYFPSAEAATKLLPIVRRTYPAALVAIAPQSNLGSLDDTATVRFSILQPVDPAPVATPPRAESPAAATPAAEYADPRAKRAAPVLTPAMSVAPQVRALPVKAPPVIEPLAKTKETQRYAVQLVWSRDPIDVAKIHWFAIFAGYLLYAVEMEPGIRRGFGVRLGFYADALSARLVAQYLRADFKGVSVVPVSEREVAMASTATLGLGSARSPKGLLVAVGARWPVAPLPVDTPGLSRAFSPVAA